MKKVESIRKGLPHDCQALSYEIIGGLSAYHYIMHKFKIYGGLIFMLNTNNQLSLQILNNLLKLRTSDLIINELFYNCEVLVIHIDDVTLW